MDEKPVSPIVAERDDMIGRSPSAARNDSTLGKTPSVTGAGAVSRPWKFLLLVVLFGLIGGAGFGWVQYQDILNRHQLLQQRFETLESRLSSTDESVTQSGAAMQLKLSKHTDELKHHWSEIRKLWGISNDINKGKIDKNKQDIAFLASKKMALETAASELTADTEKNIASINKSLNHVSASYLELSADLDATHNKLRSHADNLNQIKTSLGLLQRDLLSKGEAIESMEAFRRQINQKIYALEQRGNRVVVEPTTAATDTTQQSKLEEER